MTRLSVLDLSSIKQGSTAGAALRASLDLAQHVEKWGYHRFWLAEHHNMPELMLTSRVFDRQTRLRGYQQTMEMFSSHVAARAGVR